MVVLLGAERIAEIELETETGSKNLLSPPVFAMVPIAIKMLTCMWVILMDEIAMLMMTMMMMMTTVMMTMKRW